MALSAQDKILYVANKLGLSSLNLMQGSTGAIYDVDTDISGQIFTSASRHQNPGITNLTQNEFEVNEALLIENISFYVLSQETNQVSNFQVAYGSDAIIVYDLKIGNKVVMKDTPIFGVGSPYTFANTGTIVATVPNIGPVNTVLPRHQTFMEGAGILIPPQVQFSLDYRIFNMVTGAIIPAEDTASIGCYLFGTRVLLNFNTSI
jgi:hypothetical protein